METPNWKIFEKLVFNIQKLKYKNAEISYDDKIRDVITKRMRQVDITIRLQNNNRTELIIIECKEYNKKTLNQPNIEQFASFIKSVGADKGIMVAANGYSKSAKVYAKAMDIELFNLDEANNIDWEDYIKTISIPIIKKRHYCSNIEIISNGELLIFDKDLFMLGRKNLELYTVDNGHYLSMKDYQKNTKIRILISFAT